MLLVLPPSETKRDGGVDGSALRLDELSYPQLGPQRAEVLGALRALSRSVSASATALNLGPTQRFEIDRNRTVTTSPVLPVLERYTGVLYDGLDAAALTAAELDFANRHLVVHSALFGLVHAGDRIPAYRLSHDSRLPGVSLRKLWRAPVTEVFAAQEGLVLDLRSEAYAALGPIVGSARYIRVVSEDSRGRRVALSHFNKKAKGEFTRAVVTAGIDHADEGSLLEWARSVGIRLEPGAPGELELVTSASAAA